jgi:hypothetical protein
MLDFREYLGYAERYIKFAEKESIEDRDIEWLLIPATILPWIAIESFINNMLHDFGALPEDLFELHERAFLLEKKLRFVKEGKDIGKFVLDQTEYEKLEEKIFFLIAKFSKKKKQFKGGKLWQDFEKFKTIRNKIMHPRKGIEFKIEINDTKKNLQIAKDIIKFVSTHVWGKPVDI